MRRHITYMLIGVGVALVGLLLFGVSATDALLWAFVLVCPAMLAVVFFTMRADEHPQGPEGERHPAQESGLSGPRSSFGSQDPDGHLHS